LFVERRLDRLERRFDARTTSSVWRIGLINSAGLSSREVEISQRAAAELAGLASTSLLSDVMLRRRNLYRSADAFLFVSIKHFWPVISRIAVCLRSRYALVRQQWLSTLLRISANFFCKVLDLI
jgi:hypothetical protein